MPYEDPEEPNDGGIVRTILICLFFWTLVGILIVSAIKCGD
jgi:hypothetical protein